MFGKQIISEESETDRAGTKAGMMHSSFKKEEIKHVLEAAVTEISYRGGLYGSPVTLIVEARAKLVDTVSGEALFESQYRYESSSRKVSDWMRENGGPLSREFETALDMLAVNIVDDTLLTEKNTFGQIGFGVTGLTESSTRSLREAERCADCSNAGGAVGTLTPVLSWLPAASRVADEAVYDLAIFRRPAGEPVIGPVEPDYYRYGLQATNHRIEAPLETCQRYFWSVRARWRDGHSWAAGPWTTVGGQTDKAETVKVSMIPSLHYRNFTTPCALRSAESRRAVYGLPELTIEERMNFRSVPLRY